MKPDASTRIAQQAGAHQRWGQLNETERSAATAPARLGLEAKWLREAEGDPKRAANLRKAHYARMTVASLRARRNRRGPAGRTDQTRPGGGL
ncbi:hypothetical protein ACWDTP_04985 [Mycobacterium sp. NPDC003449]